MTKQAVRWFWVIAVTWLALARPVRAEGSNVEVLLRVKPPDRTKADAPQVEATVIGAPNLPGDKFTLREDAAAQPVELKPVSKRAYNQGTETLAIAIVMNGWEIWIGNDDVISKDDPSSYPGVLKAFEAALDKVSFKDAGPAGSVGTVITYDDKAVVRIPMEPLEKITGSQLGSQRDYLGTKGVELVKGIDLGLSELHKVQASRKVLIVVCDGMDTNMDAARSQLVALKTQAKNDQIQTFAIVYKGALSGDGNVVTAMIPSTQTVNSADNIAAAIAGILSRMADRQYLTFPGFDPALGVGLSWDGKPHNLILRVDKDDADPVALTLVPTWHAHGSTAGVSWLVVIAVAVGALVVIALATVRLRTAPPPVAEPVAGPELSPQPRGPITVAIDSDAGFPVVGWLVPLDGEHAAQTLKLHTRSTGTKIGTGSPCDIVINDGFMSTVHCKIYFSPQGFVLADADSVNGCYVNDRRIQGKHELVDNDVITLGKTMFKFKSLS